MLTIHVCGIFVQLLAETRTWARTVAMLNRVLEES